MFTTTGYTFAHNTKVQFLGRTPISWHTCHTIRQNSQDELVQVDILPKAGWMKYHKLCTFSLLSWFFSSEQKQFCQPFHHYYRLLAPDPFKTGQISMYQTQTILIMDVSKGKPTACVCSQTACGIDKQHTLITPFDSRWGKDLTL